MNSGKTIDLIRTAYNYEENGYKVLVLKPTVDTKSGDKISCRIGLERKVDVLINSSDSIYDKLKDKLNDIHCIFIDEAQFLNANQVDELFIISKAMNIPVICYGLRTDFRMEAFEGSRRLLEVAKASHPEVESLMIADASELDMRVCANKNHIVVSRGASTPEDIIDAVYNKIVNY